MDAVNFTIPIKDLSVRIRGKTQRDMTSHLEACNPLCLILGGRDALVNIACLLYV